MPHTDLPNPREPSLQPDPVYMLMRRLVTTGPLGALVRRIERWREARDDRRHGLTIDDALALSNVVHLPLTITTSRVTPLAAGSPATALREPVR